MLEDENESLIFLCMKRLRILNLFILFSFFCFSCNVNENKKKNESENETHLTLSENKNNEIVVGNSDISDCNYDYPIEIRNKIQTIGKQEILDFLITVKPICMQNVEYSESVNYLIFILLEEKTLEIVDVIENNNNIIDTLLIYEMISDPVSDLIELEAIKTKIDTLIIENKTKTRIIKSLDDALQKY